MEVNTFIKKPIIGNKHQILTKKHKIIYLYMSKDLGKLVLERLEVNKTENKRILTDRQLKIVLGDQKYEQQRSGKG